MSCVGAREAGELAHLGHDGHGAETPRCHAAPAAPRSPPASARAPSRSPRRSPAPAARPARPRARPRAGSPGTSPPARRARSARVFTHSQVLHAPRLDPRRRTPPMAQQELAQPVPRPQLILLRRLARPHQIAQRLVLRVRHPHRRQVPAAVAPRQLLGVPPIRLHPIARLHRHQRRRHDLALHPERGQLPVQHVAGRPRLVADPQPLAGGPASSPGGAPTPAGSGSSPATAPRRRGSATATAIVSACTSSPTNRVSFSMTGSFRM